MKRQYSDTGIGLNSWGWDFGEFVKLNWLPEMFWINVQKHFSQLLEGISRSSTHVPSGDRLRAVILNFVCYYWMHHFQGRKKKKPNKTKKVNAFSLPTDNFSADWYHFLKSKTWFDWNFQYLWNANSSKIFSP